jgi:putative transposase
MQEKAKELAALLAAECDNAADVQNALKNLLAGTLEQMLEAEMDEHLGYEKNSPAGDNSGNSRNGYGNKTLLSEWGAAGISVPRDRNGGFEPQIVAKRQTRTDDLEQRIVAMYAKGMSNRDIEDHLREIYGVETSPSLISRVTDKIMQDVAEWQNRPLDGIYAVVFFDGVMFKVRKDAKVVNKCVYSVLGVGMDGRKDILGIWMSENESASFYAGICNDLKNRGVRDVLIACHDNLTGISDAINAVFPKTEQQLCVIHQIRNSTAFVSYKDLKPVTAGLKLVYGAVTEDAALRALEEFKEAWDKKYPQTGRSWAANWTELSTYFKYPQEVRTLIYTTNAVEGFHRMLRKYTANKAVFPTDDAVRKSVFLAVREITKKWTLPIRDWGVIIGQLLIFFDDRLPPGEILA